MTFPFIKHPSTGTPDVMITLSVITVLAAVIKFLLDGVSFFYNGHPISFGHTDALTYGALLTPVLGAHSYQNGRNPATTQEVKKDASDI